MVLFPSSFGSRSEWPRALQLLIKMVIKMVIRCCLKWEGCSLLECGFMFKIIVDVISVVDLHTMLVQKS